MPKVVVIVSFLIVISLIFFIAKTGHFSFGKLKDIEDIFRKPRQAVSSVQDEIKDSQEKPQEIVLETRDSLQNQIQNKTNTLVTLLDKTANAVLGKKNEAKPVQIVTVGEKEESDGKNLTKIDFLKDKNLKISMARNVKHYLKFQNLPPNFCLYLDKNQYSVESDKTVAITFFEGGTFPLNLDFCDQANKNFGELVVE